MTVTEFLQELKKENLNGREFLALIGHTDISNEDYTEIRENPAIGHERLTEILENSPVSAADYVQLLETARERRRKSEQKKKREEMEIKLTALISGSTESTGNSEPRDTEEIRLTAPLDDIIPLTSPEPEPEDIWGDDLPDEISVAADEYSDGEDFDRNAARENLAKIIICLTLGVLLAAANVILLGGSVQYRPPASFGEIFALDAPARAIPRNDSAGLTQFRAENHTAAANPLSGLAASEQYLFRVTDNTVQSVRIDSGNMSNGATFVPRGDILGMLEQGNKLYVFSEEMYTITVEHAETALPHTFSMPRVVICEFGSLEFGEEPVREFVADGQLREVIMRGNGFFVITDYIPRNDINADEPRGYIPQGLELDNITFIKNAPYSNMSLITAVSGSESAVYAVSGNSADTVHYSGESLLLGFGESVLRFRVAGNILTNPTWSSVRGNARFTDERGGVIRTVTDSGTLHISSIGGSSTVVENIAAGGEIIGAAFDDSAVYIVSAEKLYAIDTSVSPPVFLNAIDTLIADVSSREFYPWGENHFFEVSVTADSQGQRQGIAVTMYGDDEPNVYNLPLNDVAFHEYTRTSAEHLREAVAVSYDRTAGAGIIVVPVTYFNAVTRIETFFVLNYIEDTGFAEIGRITEIGYPPRELAAFIRGGYIYTLWDGEIQSAASDTVTVAEWSFGRV
jgi:hypothetical protein